MAKLRQHIGGKYLTAKDVATAILAKILSCEEQEVGESKEMKWVMKFRNETTGEVMTKGATIGDERLGQLEAIFGTDDTDVMVDGTVVIYQGTTQFQGRTTPCVAFRAPKNQAAASSNTTADEHNAAGHAQQTQNEVSESDIPF